MGKLSKIIMAVLCAIMVLGCIPAANATQPAGEPECPVCGAVTWTAWDGTAPTADAHVYIPEGGLEISGKDITSAVHFVLDLRGNALTSTIQTFRLRAAGADVHFMDSVGTGSITSKASAGRHGGIMQFMAAGTLTVHGGTYALSADNVFSSANTGGLFNFNSSAGATMNVLGGTFQPGKAKLGDSIYVFGTGNTLNIGGNAVINGGVYVDAAKAVSIFGTPTIAKQAGGSAYSLITKVPVDCTGLQRGANIGIDAEGVFTTEFADAAAAEAAKACFTADDATKEIIVEGKTLKVGDKAVVVPTKELYCQHCQQTVSFAEWNGKAPTTDGHFYLPENGLTLAARVTPGKITMVLDLNGQTMDSAFTGKMFQINSGAKLILQDSSAEKTGTVISKASATGYAGIIQVYSGGLDIYGGTYKLSDTANTAKSGGLIYASKDSGQPVVNIYGGTFYGANAAEGGAIRASNTHLTITGGTFYAGKATTGGDTIMVRDANSHLVISGDPVIEGGLEIKSGLTFSISGKPVILKKAEGGSAYSLKLAAGLKIDLGTLEEGAMIGLTGSGIIVDGIAETPDAANRIAQTHFVADEAGKLATSKGTDLIITTPSATATFDCPHCDEAVTWKAWDPEEAHKAGHYYLTKNETFSGTNTMSSGTMVLNLNGYTLDSTVKLLTIGSAAKVVLMDSSADQTGIISGAARATSHAGIIQVNGGALEIWGGNYFLKDNLNTTSKNGGLVYVGAEGTLAIHDGAFWGGNVDNGGAFDINNGHLTISGGKVYAGTATTQGDSIRINHEASTLTISGSPVIEGGLYISSAASVNISGSPVIRKVEGGSAYGIKTAVPMAVSNLSGNAKIGISLMKAGEDSVFTTAFVDEAAAKAAAKFFEADDPAAAAVKLSGTALCVGAYTDATEDLNHPANDDELNILLIGNSYSYYWSEELYMLMTAAGYENVTICNVYYSGCSLEKHWTWHENGTAPENYLLCIVDKNGYRQTRNTELATNLTYKKWDAISFQQSGSYVYGKADPMSSLRGSMEPWLGNLYGLATKDHPHAKYHWLQSWAHEIGNGVKNLEEQAAVTNVYRTIAQEVCQKYGFTRVPCGEAWELVRHDPIIKENGWTLTTRTGDDPDTTETEVLWDDLTHDGDVGGGQFLNACVWFEVLTGQSVLDVPVAPFYLDAAGTRYDMSAAKVELLKNAAHTAVQAIYGQPDEEEPTEPSEPEVTRGDVNGDGAVSDADAMYLLRYTLFGESRYPLNQSGDVNGDGAVSDADAMYLLRYTLFGPTRYPLH